ncbi:MAG: hypothetical protein ACODAU_01310 [Myxococcota bacterium]
MDLPFDRVVIRQPEGDRQISAQEFLGLPLHERIRMILQRNLEFFAGSETIERSEALKSLRQAS